MNNNSKAMKDTPKIWNDTEVKLLKKWGEQAASYRVLHNRAYRKYKYLTALFTIPVIIISTLTGTANFSQGTIIQIYPQFDLYLPLVIGALNLISGIVTTIGQFLRVSELNEANRNASISYGKFARNISTELSLPPNERTYSGLDFIQICRNEMDRLIEQSPEIPMKIINKFEHNKKFAKIVKPELINISAIDVYKPTAEEKAKEMVAGAASKFRNKFLTNKLKELEPEKDSSSKFKEFTAKRNVELELADLRDNKLANNPEIKSRVSAIFKKDDNNDDNDDNIIPNIKNVKNLFENVEHNKRSNNIKKPPKKISSIMKLVDKDNLDKIKSIQENKSDKNTHVSIDVNKLKTSLLDKIDETKKNIDNNLNTNVDISEIETNLDEINNVITNTTDETTIEDKNINVDNEIIEEGNEIIEEGNEIIEEINKSIEDVNELLEINTLIDNDEEEKREFKNIVKDKAINKENTEDDIANETEEEQ